ncbi:hypothetical protein C8F04DRAFT_1293724 [Mycena alexandri]|uniref:Novel STAND NTPase 1 domain-containing protein n=1 Tax=Mycena alexandri TaxID=1745969 RepID=A0AAD6WWC6_9AGAR|nr:hypothetical protein C8F04DRAFT_1293724 [Mycena alexandri]
MSTHTNIHQVQLDDTRTSLTIFATTLQILASNLCLPYLEPISNTIQSVASMVETIKQNKKHCLKLMDHSQQLVMRIIALYLEADGGMELPASTLNHIGMFTETLHKVHVFVEAQQTSSKVKAFFRQNEMSALLKGCLAGLQQGLDFFKVRTKMDSITSMQEEAHRAHQEILDMIEALSDGTSTNGASLKTGLYSGSHNRLRIYGSSSSNSISMLPTEPQIFHGRESELADILKLFNQGTPKIVILGAGGMGKTSLARTLLHHPNITARYQQYRYFVACDSITTKVELAGAIGAHMGLRPGKDLSRGVIQHLSSRPTCLLILDNLETVWEPSTSRKETEEFLSLLTDVVGLALLITMRGAERPSKVQWTRPFLPPLQPLAQVAARDVFLDIADDWHAMEEVDQVLALTDNVPLVISLLAHLADTEGCSEILSRWETEKTSIISDGYDRRSNLQISIALSLSSPRVTSVPHSQELLSLLSMLPDGLSDEELKESKFPIPDILGSKAALLRTALAYSDDNKRLKVLVPIREYMQNLQPPTDQMIRPLFQHLQKTLEMYANHHGHPSGAMLHDKVVENYTNIQNILQIVLNLGHPDLTSGIHCISRLNIFSIITGRGMIPLLRDLTTTSLSQLRDHELRACLLLELLRWRESWSSFSPETLIDEAMKHFKHFDNSSMTCDFYTARGVYYFQHTRDTPAAMGSFQNALTLAKSTGDPSRQCEALFHLAHAQWYLGNYTGAKAHAHELRRLASTIGDLHREARGLSIEGACWKALGNYRQCTSLIERSRSLLDLCGLTRSATGLNLMNMQVEVHKLKSEYADAQNLNTLMVQYVEEAEPHFYAGFLMNMAEIEVYMNAPRVEVQQKIDKSRSIFAMVGDARLMNACNYIQADLNLREGDKSSLLFCECLRAAWGRDWEIASFCLERLADSSRWQGAHCPFWSIVYLTHSLKSKDKLGIYKALQLIGDSFLEDDDQVTAISLFNLALEGFTSMNVHHSRAECMIRLGDIWRKDGDLLKALELWEMARPLFERSSQGRRVEAVDQRLDKVSEDEKEQHRDNLARLAHLGDLNVPSGNMEEIDSDLSEIDELS